MASVTELGLVADVDDRMAGLGSEEDEGEGDVIMPGAEQDSSEEDDEDDEEEARRVREGFIVDEEEDEDEEDEEERRKRRKRAKHRRRQEAEALEEDDLALLEENTGASFKQNRRLTRLRRGHGSESPPAASSSRRRNMVESSDDDLENDEPLPKVQDLHRIWDKDDDEDDGEQDMDDFIDYSDDPDAAAMNEQERDERRRRRQLEQDRRKKALTRPELIGIDPSAWEEIHEVFGSGHEYDWALDDDPNTYDANEEETIKPETKFNDVFEPTEIRGLFLTEDDDLLRAQDIPERMQLSTSTFHKETVLVPLVPFGKDDVDNAAGWVTPQLSPLKTLDFFSPNGKNFALKTQLVAAVSYVLGQLFIENVEVPYIWNHKRDHLSDFDAELGRPRSELLNLFELWQIYTLGQKYRSFLDRRRGLADAYTRLKVKDSYYEQEIIPRMDSVEVVADTSEWLMMKYKDKKQEESQFRFHDDDEPQETTVKRKMPSRISAYEIAKKSVVSKLARGFGIHPHEVVQNFLANEHVHFVEDQELNPIVYAEQFVSPDPLQAQPPEELLSRARMIMATELGKDPLLRDHMRKLFKGEGRLSVEPTDHGVSKITNDDKFFSFKYLHQKPVRDMLGSGSQFLHMLKAEDETLVKISITLPPDVKATFERRLSDALASDSFSEAAKSWNEQGSLVVQEVLDQHLLPLGAKWTREYIREEVEDALASQVAEAYRKRIDVAPLTVRGMKEDRPSVLALSWGKGDPHKDAIHVVFLDPRGRLRESTKLDNLTDAGTRQEFIDLLRRRRPDVIGVGGFNMTTTKLRARVREIVQGLSIDIATQESEQFSSTPVIYVRDDVARLYQHSRRANAEFSSHSLLTKYCIGLARYVQSPVNEYAAIGSDVSAVFFEGIEQHIIPTEKLWIWCERVIIDVVNKVGVDINRAVGDVYYQTLLPYVCGLGPRKAQLLVKSIERLGENIVNREQFIKAGLLTKTLFINAAGFLRISQQEDLKTSRFRADDDHAPDPLDDTRIHPEDYELARKMAMDALEYDEEDVHDKHPSWVVGLIMEDPENDKKLSELNLDEFAVNLFSANHDLKRHTLNVIRDELSRPFAEQRDQYLMLEGPDVLTMLSGETPNSLGLGLVVTATVVRSKNNYIGIKLDSGVEGIVPPQFIFGGDSTFSKDIPIKGQTITGVVLAVKTQIEEDNFSVELSIRPEDIERGDTDHRATPADHYWDKARHDKDSEMLARKKRAEVDRTRKVIKHPNFHNFNTAQAETYLEKQQRGDVVMRPSSKGADHLAVTWKVDDQLYQHIDVTEINDVTGRTAGTQFIVDATHIYADLDELIVNHVQAMARKVEELMAHDRYKHGTEDDLHLYLKNSLAANPAKSMYGFALNRKRPGHFSLCFLANKNSVVQTWPVRVTPESYMLFDAAAVGVPELCDAFKVRHLHETNQVSAATGAKTPFGAGTRTPARPGNATPGHMSVRQPARTPNPYGSSTTPARYGGGTPAPFAPGIPQAAYNIGAPQPPYGYQTPSHRPPFPPLGQPLPGGMNPARAAYIQQGGTGWP
ncbi:transcription elongation factor SPT6 [Mycena pura]|uniref:Transcription elongation factor Spt6 n=1 Tax=Mycena pura TaxID=153505 RepID=A0AAD6YKD3_9AGAR|nr:transcription elongation factor SPT6 [Mycena pura]